jgi:L-amino acid N-acyltransferase YncA
VSDVRVRPVLPEDAAAIAGIYAPYVRETAVTFELDAPDPQEMVRRIAVICADHPYLVAEVAGVVRGYAYAGKYRPRAAFRWTVETTIYVDREHPGRGIGGTLYRQLIDACVEAGFVTAIGVIALPNRASVALHERLGFTAVGTQAGVGYKHGRWHDVGFWQRDLAPRSQEPPEPGGRGTPAL